jgi:prolyl 4-hydroxylase
MSYSILCKMGHFRDSVKMQETKRTPMFERSLVNGADGQRRRSNSRTSSTAILPVNDAVVQCIAKRASEFQGFVPLYNIEALQATKYTEGQEYKPHWDWGGHNRHRDTTFFGIIDVSCETCGTHFPALGVNWAYEDRRWCQFVDCDNIQSLIVRPVPGSALFWRNLHSNGTGDIRTLHAGLPAQGGVKIGLNIWTRTKPFD